MTKSKPSTDSHDPGLRSIDTGGCGGLDHYKQRGVPTNTQLLMRQATCYIVRMMDHQGLIHSVGTPEYLSKGILHSFTSRGDIVVQREDQFIIHGP